VAFQRRQRALEQPLGQRQGKEQAVDIGAPLDGEPARLEQGLGLADGVAAPGVDRAIVLAAQKLVGRQANQQPAAMAQHAPCLAERAILIGHRPMVEHVERGHQVKAGVGERDFEHRAARQHPRQPRAAQAEGLGRQVDPDDCPVALEE
jgi:hypothetical protein